MISVKKSLSVLLAAAMLAASLPIVSAAEIAQATSPVTASEEDFTVRDDGKGGVEISEYKGQGGDVIIPETISGKSVTKIWNGTFRDCGTLTSIKIPNSVTEIGVVAFEFCESLTSIEIPNSVTTIGDGAFCSCRSLTSIKIPNSVTEIGNRTFEFCESLTSIEIPNSVTKISNSAFSVVSSLTEINVDEKNENYSSENGILFNKDKAVLIKYPPSKEGYNYDIPSSVKVISVNAFDYCKNLVSINIPNSVIMIGDGAFVCYGAEINVDEKNEFYSSENGILFNKDKTVLIHPPCSQKDKTYVIPSSVTTIGNAAFYICESLTSIEIPNSVTTIGDYVFGLCFSLTSIEIPNSVTTIGDGAFSSCCSLTSIKIPNSVTEIGNRTFEFCESLTSIEIPNSVTTISAETFFYCNSLTSIKIPDSVTKIGDRAFMGCDSLTSIEIPDSVTNIGNSAFRHCSSSLTIYGYANSYAETYAKENNINFKELNGKIILDETTGITISNDELDLSDKTLSVSKTDSNETSVTYDIELKDENGKAVQPEKPVTVKIPVPAGFDGSKCKVYRMEQDGTLTDMNASYENGCMVFVTSHFSKYELRDMSVSPGDVNGDGKINSMDALWVLQAASGKRTLIDTQKAAADVNNDNKINSMDALWILQAASGKRTLS